jgi:plastocyanin
MTNKRACIIIVVALLTYCAVVSARGEAKPEPVAILKMGDINMSTISPAKITIRVGDTVKWINAGAGIHIVRSLIGSPQFRSKYLQPGESFEYKFTQPGTYRYSWMAHTNGRSAKGYIVVLPETAPVSSRHVGGE